MNATQLDFASVANHPMHDADRDRIVAAIRDDANTHNGQVDANRVRAALTNAYGLMVPPRLLSATYGSLARSGVLVHDGWTTNTDAAGGNAGKPARLWRLVA